MKITITGFSVEAQRVDYTLQTMVKGSITGTYSASKPAEKSIACNVLEHLGSVSAGPYGHTLQPEQALLGMLYTTHYQGSFADLVGQYGEARDVPANMVWERITAPVELPTADDLAYINENAKPADTPVWKAQGDANQYCLLDARGHWVAAIQLNGEMSVVAQEQWLDRYFKRG